VANQTTLNLKCWGQNSYGQLGYNDIANNKGDAPGEMGNSLEFVNLGAASSFVQRVALGQLHTCAMVSATSNTSLVKCWGYNNKGQLGYGDTVTRKFPISSLAYVNLGIGRTVKHISCGYNFACAILDTSKVKCWGDGFNGQLGYGNNGQSRGSTLGDMGDNLPYVSLSSSKTVKNISSGYYFTCAILDDSKLKCWGSNTAGQLGQGNTNTMGDAISEMGNNLPYTLLGTGLLVRSVSTGYMHACAVMSNGYAKCWGSNGYGQLGYGDLNARDDGPGEMNDALLSVNLGSGRTVKQIACGYHHTCALLDNDQVRGRTYNSVIIKFMTRLWR
jgi:alpha-tubulin suppressor-like RCC1 family protein